MAHWLKVLDVLSEDWSGVHTSGAVTNAHNSSSRDRMSSGWTCMCSCAHTDTQMTWFEAQLSQLQVLWSRASFWMNSSAWEFVRCWEAWRRLCEYQPLLLMVSCPSRQRPQNPKAYVESAYGGLCVAFLSSVLDFTLYPVLKGNLSFSQQCLGPFLGLKCWEVWEQTQVAGTHTVGSSDGWYEALPAP